MMTHVFTPDQGSLTLLWSQPVAALQIMTPDGKWKWVKHVDNALVRITTSEPQRTILIE